MTPYLSWGDIRGPCFSLIVLVYGLISVITVFLAVIFGRYLVTLISREIPSDRVLVF